MKVQNIELRLDYSSVGAPLQGLSHAAIDDIVQCYYDKHKTVKSTLEKYDIHVRRNLLVKYLPGVKSGATCRYDGTEMIESLATKSYVSYDAHDQVRLDPNEFDERLNLANRDDHCPVCGHIEEPYCRCRNCQSSQEDTQEKRREAVVITNISMSEDDRPDLSYLSLYDRLVLGALLRGFLSEDMTYVHGVNTRPQEGPLLPDEKVQFDTISRFLDNRVLIIAHNSDLSAFNFDSDNNIPSYYPLDVNYVLNLTHPFDTRQELIEHLCYPNKQDFLEDADSYFRIDQDICLDECKKFLMFELSKVNFDHSFRPGAKTSTVLKHLLDDFSEGQVFYMIHNKVTNATRYYQEYHVSQKQAANSVVTNLERYGEQILANDWNVAAYHWPYKLQRSQLSHFFFDYISV